jgi:hypothetical protein
MFNRVQKPNQFHRQPGQPPEPHLEIKKLLDNQGGKTMLGMPIRNRLRRLMTSMSAGARCNPANALL